MVSYLPFQIAIIVRAVRLLTTVAQPRRFYELHVGLVMVMYVVTMSKHDGAEPRDIEFLQKKLRSRCVARRCSRLD